MRVRLAESRTQAQLTAAVLAAIGLLALALRLFRLGDWSFWGDEFFTVSGREDGFNYQFFRRSLASDLIQLAVRLLGPTEWAARLVPALIGALTVVLLYFLLKPFAPRAVSPLAALFLAVSPWHLYWSQNARFYTLLLLFGAVSAVFFYRGLEEDRPHFLILALVFLGLATRERLVALFLVPAFALYPLLILLLRLARPPGLQWSRLLLFFAPLVLMGIPFILPYTRNFSAWMQNFGPATNSPLRILAGTVVYMTIPVAVLAVFAAVRLVLSRRRAGLFFGLVAVTPVLLMMALSLVHYAANRYVFVSLVGWVVLAAWAVDDLFLQAVGGGKVLAAGVLAVVLAVCLVDIGFYFTEWKGNRQDWKGALVYIRERMQPDDQVVVADVGLAEYYLGRQPLEYSQVDWVAPGAERVWVVEEESASAAYGAALGQVQAAGRLMAVFDVAAPGRRFPMRVYLYSRAGAVQD